MNLTTRTNLVDILDSCLFIQSTCATRTFDDYQNDRLFRRAIEREFEIAGESLKRIRDEEERLFNHILYAHDIIGFRNRLVHGYDSIDDAIVWGVISGHLPRLISEITELLKK